MPRQIKRYGSRKLYDTGASRYISMQDLAAMIQTGEEVEVVDNDTGEDVTIPILTQVISEQGKRGSTFPRGLLHDLIRAGEEAIQAGEGAVTASVKQVQQSVEGFVQRAARDTIGKLKQPLDSLKAAGTASPMREEMDLLRQRLDALEDSLRAADAPPADSPPTTDS